MLILGFVTFSYLLETYLDIRQHNNYKVKVLPEKIKKYNIITQEEFAKSQAYGLDKSNFGFFHDFFDFVQNILVLVCGVLPYLWGVSAVPLRKFGYEDSEVLHSCVFVVLLILLSSIISMPFELYSTFVIEERHGFNKQTLGLYFKDKVKSFLLFIVIGLPILSAVLLLIKMGGPHFWFYLWLFLIAVTLIMVTIYPTLIAPIFNKFEPLPEGDLRDKIYALSKRVDFPTLRSSTHVDGSKRSGHSNAYNHMDFFKNKRIVLYDTLINQVDTPGIVAVLAHELGHFKMSHTYKNLVLTQLYMLVFLFLFSQSLFNVDLYRSFGFSTEPALIGLTLFSYIYGPVDHVFSFLMHMLSRHFEYQADEYAVKLGYDLTEPLAKLSTSNKSSVLIDPLYSAYHHTHPTLLERIDNIAVLKKKYQN
uniref:CAAX prenyl protease n=1 Tax=Physarum polycephalum TaxID=5791 RepID=Q967X5_PHYPO|nr:Afc1 protein [Physarum polycephalum]